MPLALAGAALYVTYGCGSSRVFPDNVVEKIVAPEALAKALLDEVKKLVILTKAAENARKRANKLSPPKDLALAEEYHRRS